VFHLECILILLFFSSKGLVGKHLCNSLIETKINVVTNDKNKHEIDVTDMNRLRSIDKVEAIVHLAAKTSIKDLLNNPYETHNTNLLGTLNLLEFTRLKDIKKFIYISTYVYGQPKYLPIDENHHVNPHSIYNKSKLLAEEPCENYADNFGIDIVTPLFLFIWS
jgi:UDP-glucose 4-epimerase